MRRTPFAARRNGCPESCLLLRVRNAALSAVGRAQHILAQAEADHDDDDGQGAEEEGEDDDEEEPLLHGLPPDFAVFCRERLAGASRALPQPELPSLCAVFPLVYRLRNG